MKFPLLGKLVALGAVIVVLLLSLNAVHGLVNERRARQFEAEQSVADSLAGQQTVLGPVLQLRCEELWTRTEGSGKDQKTINERRELISTAWPSRLNVIAQATIEPRYRGLFKLNGYAAKNAIVADWAPLAQPQPAADHPGARIAVQLEEPAVTRLDRRLCDDVEPARPRRGDEFAPFVDRLLVLAAAFGARPQLFAALLQHRPEDGLLAREAVGHALLGLELAQPALADEAVHGVQRQQQRNDDRAQRDQFAQQGKFHRQPRRWWECRESVQPG